MKVITALLLTIVQVPLIMLFFIGLFKGGEWLLNNVSPGANIIGSVTVFLFIIVLASNLGVK